MIRLVVCACALLVSARASVVVTSSGPVRGTLIQEDGFSYYAYQAIPYAESPTGDLRFEPPVPKKPWSEVRDATQQGPVCPQAAGKIPRKAMSEDCLNINVFVPANRSGPLPVLAYFHGGAFKSNSGNIDIMFGPQLLLQRGIIHVTMNFRLGALGYLSLGTEKLPGNAGLKDLLLALKWIKENIHKFGGTTITIGGQSSGAAMVHQMLLTDKSTGLFDRAILNSGSATNFRYLSNYPREHTLALANELGISDDCDDIVIQNLRKADVFDIVEAQENLYKNRRNIMSPFAPFVPCIEKESNHSILTRKPIDIINAGIPQNVPILLGINSLEGAYMWPGTHNVPTKTLQEQISLAFPADIEYPKDSDMHKKLVDSVSELYFGDVNKNNWTLHNFYELLSDTQYTSSIGSWIKIHKNRSDSKRVYYYLFNFDGDLNWGKLTYNVTFPGVIHADEIGYYFVNKVTKEKLKHLDTKNQRTLDHMLTFISNFVKFGDPTPLGVVRVRWPEHGNAGRHLVINDRPSRGSHEPFAKRFAFWTNVYKQFDQYVQNGGVREPQIPLK